MAFAISLSRFVEFIEPADTNRFVTAKKSISHDRRLSISLSLLPPPSSPLDLCLVVAGTLLLLSVFCNSARYEGERGGKKTTYIQGYKISSPSMDFERPPTTRALANIILFALVPLENAASIEAK